MSTAALHPVSEKILSGQASEPLCLAAARGAVPVPPEELLRLRVHLARTGGAQVAEVAREALASQPSADLIAAVSGAACPVEILDYVARTRTDDPVLMAALLQNPSTPDEAFVEAAAAAPAAVLERILDNQVRLLRCAPLVDALEANPGLTGSARTRLIDVQREWQRRSRRELGADAVTPAATPTEAAPGTAEAETAPAAAPPAAEPEVAPPEPDAVAEPEIAEVPRAAPEEGDALLRIMNMTVPEKIELALKGNREERSILIRDPIKVVALSVLKSAKLTDPEIEAFAALRNVVEDVIRIIGENREWTKNYAVIHSLCKNPKTPVRKVLTLMTRLNNRDLKLLGTDRGVSEVVRNNARRFYVARTQPKVFKPGRKR